MPSILPIAVTLRQPPSVTAERYRIRMEPESKRIVRENALQLLRDRGDVKEGKTGVGALIALGLPNGSAQRLLAEAGDVTMKQLDVLAKGLRVKPWQLLVPGFADGASGESHPEVQDDSIGVAQMLDRISDPQIRARAVAEALSLAVKATREAAAARSGAPAPQPPTTARRARS